MNKVTVTIQGANYIMVGEKTDKEILTIANYVNSEMDKLKKVLQILVHFKYQF